MMLKVLFYSYRAGVMSSRGMWDALKTRADYIYLSGDQVPDFRTLNDFRTRHLERLPGLFAKIVHLYQERAALTIDSMTGKPFDGLFKYEPTRDLLDRIVDDSAEYPFRVITYKNFFHAMARTSMNPSLLAIKPTNFVEMNASDGRGLGLETGDAVRVVSPSGSIEKNAVVFLSEGIRPGVVAVAHSYGLWALSSTPFYVNGRRGASDRTRSSGIAINPIMRVDPVLGNVSLQDKVGASVSFQDTNVRIEKLTG